MPSSTTPRSWSPPSLSPWLFTPALKAPESSDSLLARHSGRQVPRLTVDPAPCVDGSGCPVASEPLALWPPHCRESTQEAPWPAGLGPSPEPGSVPSGEPGRWWDSACELATCTSPDLCLLWPLAWTPHPPLAVRELRFCVPPSVQTHGKAGGAVGCLVVSQVPQGRHGGERGPSPPLSAWGCPKASPHSHAKLSRRAS